MENNHKLGLYVSYYLSRFNREAYQNLGYGNQSETHNKIGKLLTINPHTVKNWRDEFDPLFGNRVGWYQRPMNPSRIRVAQALENLDELQIRNIVIDILSEKIKDDPNEEEQLLFIASNETASKITHNFILRGPTGKAAEEYFIKYYFENKKPIEGNLIDCRDFGVGYDFRIEIINKKYYIEVKGLSTITGGILFTNKEWLVARNEGESYILCLVSNLDDQPQLIFIENPYDKLKPKRNIFSTIQINWSVSENQLIKFHD